MSIFVTCQDCGTRLKVPDEYEGQVGLCPTCESEIKIVREEPAAPPSPGPQAAPASGPKPAETPAAAPPAEPPERKLKLLTSEAVGNVGVVRFATSRILDASNVDQLGEEFTHLVKDENMTKMVVNFQNIEYMSSAVIGKLITLNKSIATAGGKVKFCCIDEGVMEIFTIMRLDKLIKIYEKEEDALDSFREWF